MPLRDTALVLGVMLIWGLNFVFAKTAFAYWPPIMFTAARFAVTAAVLLPFARFPRGRFGAVALLSFTLGTVHFSLMFTGVGGTDASVAAILVQTQVPFAALLAWGLLGDNPGWRGAIGQVVAFAGVVVLAGDARGGGSPLPAAMVIGAAFVWALSAIQVKRLGAIDSITLNAWTAVLAVPQLVLVSAALEHGQIEALTTPNWFVWVCVLYMALGVTVIGYIVWYRMLARHPINQLMAFTLLVPVFAVASSHLVLGEELGWRRLLGGFITIVGVAIIVLRPPPAGPGAAEHANNPDTR